MLPDIILGVLMTGRLDIEVRKNSIPDDVPILARIRAAFTKPAPLDERLYKEGEMVREEPVRWMNR
ncbi:MAG TPA: hypothetical protein VMZ05_08495 [Spirochaetota bacterium]|nr:hypothetical protein [Spirochaetota bacterium]